MNRAPIETIKENVEHCGFTQKSEIRRGDAFSFLAGKADTEFHYIYIAPPQYKEMWLNALKHIDENMNWLTEDGTVIVQIDPREYKEVSLTNLVEGEQRKYGSTLLIFYDRA
jgi:16S rRNA G966 N2-methylase RsmD